MIKSKKLIAVLMSFAMILSVAGVTMPANTIKAAKVNVKSVKVNAPYSKKAYVAKGKSITLSKKVTVTPNKSANKAVTFKSNNKKVATVSSKGVVKAKKTGTTKIVVTSKKNKKKKATITVKVMSKAVTKVKLNKKNASMKPGETLQLKKTISPSKNAGKVVKWTSSNKKVATVSTSGKVTAVAAGTTTVKAIAADGSKKSAKCNVTVKDVTDLVSIQPREYDMVELTFSKAVVLNASNFAIYMKTTAEGNYIKQYEIANIISSDLIHYSVYLKTDKIGYLRENDYVKAVVSGLSGRNTLETKVAFPKRTAGLSEQIVSKRVGAKVDTLVYFENYVSGTCSYSAQGLPAGITIEERSGDCYLVGKAVGVVDNAIATITATDETGKVASRNVRFLFGSETEIVAYIPNLTVLSNKNQTCYRSIYIEGGCSSYSIEAVTDANLTALKDASFSAYSDKYYFRNYGQYNNASNNYETGVLPVGNYGVTYVITDSANPALSIQKNIVISSVQGAEIKGTVRDAAGEPISGYPVQAYCTSSNDLESSYYSEQKTDANGNYLVRVVENQTYRIACYSVDAYIDQVTPSVAGMAIDLKSPLYKVIVGTPLEGATNIYEDRCLEDDGTYSYEIGLYDLVSRERCTMRNNIVYLYPGTYHMVNAYGLTARNQDKELSATYNLDFSVIVGNANQAINASVTDQLIADLKERMQKTLTIQPGLQQTARFVAPKDGIYRVSSGVVLDDVEFGDDSIDAGSSLKKYYSWTKGQVFTFKFDNRYNDSAIVIPDFNIAWISE